MSRALMAPLAAALLLMAACGGGGDEVEEGSAARTSSAATTTSAAAGSATSTAPAGDQTFKLAAAICTDGISEPDQLVTDAAHGAQNGTRSVTEVAEAFRNAQDAVEALSDQASADYPRLSQSLQTYADTLGRARVSGDVGLSEITAAREDLNTACLIPASPAT